MGLVYIIEDESIMADCIALAVRGAVATNPDGTESVPEVEIFHDAVTAIDAIDKTLPDLILLDVLLSGPDGFTFLNELVSYHDTAQIPVALITSLNLAVDRLEAYGVFRVLNKGTMTPLDIQAAVRDGFALRASLQNSEPLPELIPDQPIAAQIAELDLSPEALAVIHGDPSTVMDSVFGMPPTDEVADTEPIDISAPGDLENPAEPLDFIDLGDDNEPDFDDSADIQDITAELLGESDDN